MDQPLSNKLVGTDFDVVRRGYDPIAVSAFLGKVSEQARKLETELATARARLHALEVQPESAAGEHRPESLAFSVAADAKKAMLDDAEKQANRIFDRARDKANQLSEPLEDVEQSRLKVADLMLQAKRRLDAADDEAEQVVRAARLEAEEMTARTRNDALSAVTASKREAESLLSEAQNEYRRISLMLRGLKSAVKDMLDEGGAESDAIRVVISDTDSAASQSDQRIALS